MKKLFGILAIIFLLGCAGSNSQIKKNDATGSLWIKPIVSALFIDAEYVVVAISKPNSQNQGYDSSYIAKKILRVKKGKEGLYTVESKTIQACDNDILPAVFTLKPGTYEVRVDVFTRKQQNIAHGFALIEILPNNTTPVYVPVEK